MLWYIGRTLTASALYTSNADKSDVFYKSKNSFWDSWSRPHTWFHGNSLSWQFKGESYFDFGIASAYDISTQKSIAAHSWESATDWMCLTYVNQYVRSETVNAVRDNSYARLTFQIVYSHHTVHTNWFIINVSLTWRTLRNLCDLTPL